MVLVVKQMDKHLELEYDCIIYDCYKDLLKKKIYEPIILKLMNLSEIVFRENYEYIESQSHRESDFVSKSGVFYDAKLLFYDKQCQALAINEDNLYTFISELQREINEVYVAINKNEHSKLVESIFYKEMLDRIERAEKFENIILFIPFACTLEVSSDLSSLLHRDIFFYIFKFLIEENSKYLEEHNVYLIYPNCENYIIIKNLNDDTMEFIMDDVLKKYIEFEIRSS